jgi:hypothetical protein
MPTPQEPEKISLKSMLHETRLCNRGISKIQETLKNVVNEIENIKTKQADAAPSSAISGFASDDQYVQAVCLELAPVKLIQIFKQQDKRCLGVGTPGHANNIPFMEWCRLLLAEFVYHTGVDMSGTRKKEILQKIARNMYRVMKSFDVQSPFPADVSFIYGMLDRKYTDWLKNERKLARQQGIILLLFFTNLSNFMTCFFRNFQRQRNP